MILAQMDWVNAGDYELSLNGPWGSPTLRLGIGLETDLALNLHAIAAEPKHSHLGVHLHSYYLEECEQILGLLASTFPPFDLIITTDTVAKRNAIELLLSKHISAPWTQRLEVLVVHNQGRNVIPLLREGIEFLKPCTVALHLHTKRTEHKDFGTDWLNSLLKDLIGNTSRLNAIIDVFAANKNLGLVMPRPRQLIRSYLNWGANYDTAAILVQALWPEQRLDRMAPLIFPQGMMFWFRPKALEPLKGAPQALGSMPLEPILQDGTALHAIERITTHSCEISGMDWALLNHAEDEHYNKDSLASLSKKRVSVWQPQPDAYLQGIANLSVSHREIRLRLEELGRKHNAIAEHRDVLELSIVERDKGLAERDKFLKKRTEEIELLQKQHQSQLQVILDHRDNLERALSEQAHALDIRDTFVAERTRELEQVQKQHHSQLKAIVDHRDSLEKGLTERDAAIKDLQLSLKAIVDHRDSLEKGLTERDAAIKEIQRQLNEIIGNRDSLKDELNTIKSGMVWRMTSPLRRTTQKFGKP